VISAKVACFESYGVRVKLESETSELLEIAIQTATKALVGRLKFIENTSLDVDHEFGLHQSENGDFFFTNNGQPSGSQQDIASLARTLNTMVRIHVAEKAVGWVFIHAGVVGYRDKAIVLPAMSHQGKTTLVAELIKCGAEYFSDEYAVLDEQGSVHPFERPLSVRKQRSEVSVDVPVEQFGARSGTRPIPVGMVILTGYDADAGWDPKTVSLGEGILETLPQVISINFNTEFALKVLNTAYSRAIILKSLRGDAHGAARSILSLFDNSLNLGRIL